GAVLPTCALAAQGPRGISCDDHSSRHVPRHHASGPDHGAIADAHSGQDDGPAADPHIAPDRDLATKLVALPAHLRIAWVIRGIDLHRRADLRSIADGNGDDVEEHAVVIDEHAVAEPHVEAVVAEERRTDHGSVPERTQALLQDLALLGARLRE